jgi:RecB family exonuclease
MQPSEVKWSFSSLKDYINCPRQYHELKVLKRYEKRPTEQMLYGSAVHKALEHYVGDGKPLPDDYKRYAPQLDPLKDMPGDKYPEKRMAVGFDRTPSKWTEYWARGIVDLLVVDEDTGFIVDYKTGNDKYADLKQLQLMALLSFAHFPQLERIKSGLLFVAKNNFIQAEYLRKDQDALWADFIPHLERLRLSFANDEWQPNPTPLCSWCPVLSCEFHKER